MKRILTATRFAVASLAKPDSTVLLFHDKLAAWRNKKKSNRGYYFHCHELDELTEFLENEICFRDPTGRSDNYNIVDKTGKWMLTFCHHDDWFLFAPIKQLNGLKAKIGTNPEY